jgi:hypothetical protein
MLSDLAERFGGAVSETIGIDVEGTRAPTNGGPPDAAPAPGDQAHDHDPSGVAPRAEEDR